MWTKSTNVTPLKDSSPLKISSAPHTFTPPVPTLSALSRGITPVCSPRTKIHKLLPFSPAALGARPQGHRPRTGGPRAKWIDVESTRPHTARDSDKQDVYDAEEKRRPHTSRQEPSNLLTPERSRRPSRPQAGHQGAIKAPHTPQVLDLSTDEQQLTPVHQSAGRVAVLGGRKAAERNKVFSMTPVPVIGSNIPKEVLKAHGGPLQAARELRMPAEHAVPERAHPLHAQPVKKLYSDLPMEHTLPIVFGEGRREDEWETHDQRSFSFEGSETWKDGPSRAGSPSRSVSPTRTSSPTGRGASPVRPHRSEGQRSEFMSTPEPTPIKQPKVSQAFASQEMSSSSQRSPIGLGVSRGPSGEQLQRENAFRTHSSGVVSSLSTLSVAASAPAELQIEAPRHLEPEKVHRVLEGLPLVCGGRMRVSKDFAKILRKKEQHLKARVMSALHLKAEASKYRKHIVHQNSRTAWSTPTLSTESLTNWHAVRDLRMHHAAQKRKALEDARQKFKEDALEWKESYSDRLQQTEERYQAALERRFLFASVVLAARSREWARRLLRRRAEMAEQRKRNWAVAVIAKKFRERLMYNYHKRYRQALLALSMKFAACIQRWRAQARKKKVAIIITFLQEVRDSAKLQVAVKRYRGKIKRCQDIARQYIMCNRARYLLLELQWAHVDEARIRAFVRNRAEQLHKVKRALTPSMRLAGSKLEEMNSKMRMIARLGGPKTLRQCQLEMEQARNKYMELFLSAEMKEVPKISPAVKQRMLEMYVKKIRTHYTQEYLAYRKRLDNWNAMQQTHHSLSLVANSMISDVEGTHGETYLKHRLKEVLELESPKPPTMHMVLKREVMQQIVMKAVETTRRLEAKQLSREGSRERPAIAREPSTEFMPGGSLKKDTAQGSQESFHWGKQQTPRMGQKRLDALLQRTGTTKDVLMI